MTRGGKRLYILYFLKIGSSNWSKMQDKDDTLAYSSNFCIEIMFQLYD